MAWSVGFYSRSLEEEILALPAGFVARFVRFAERMEVYGPNLGMPHTRAMGDGLFELRIKAAEGIARVFYSTLGHTNESWDDPDIQKMYFEAIRWALGMTEGSTAPHAKR